MGLRQVEQEPRKKVGFFGGTFDPIHFGHLNLALHLKETQSLDEVLFCPAAQAPQKADHYPIASKEERWQMVELALQGMEGFKGLNIELLREAPSFTVDSIRELRTFSKYSIEKVDFYLILGEDTLEHLPEWKEIDELFSLTTPLIGRRLNKSALSQQFPPFVKKKLELGEVAVPIMEISSTTIRQRLKEKKYCSHLLPTKVLDYIHEHRLYFS